MRLKRESSNKCKVFKQIIVCLVFVVLAIGGCGTKKISLEGVDWQFVSMDYDGTTITVDKLQAIDWDLPTIVFTSDGFVMDNFGKKLQGNWKTVGDNQYRFTGADESYEDGFDGILTF